MQNLRGNTQMVTEFVKRTKRKQNENLKPNKALGKKKSANSSNSLSKLSLVNKIFYLSIHPPIYLSSIYLTVCLSVCLSVCLIDLSIYFNNFQYVNCALPAWTKVFLSVLDKHTPCRTRRIRKKPLPQLNPNFKQLVFKRDWLRRKATKTGMPED